MRIVLLVDMDAFFASCEQAFDPRLKNKPVIVCGNPKTRTVVAACSYEAKARGVENGMSIGEALALCPGAIRVAGHMERYADIAHQIFSGLERFTPLVEVVSIDEAFLDVTDTWQRFGSAEEISRRIQGEVKAQHDILCTVGIGPNKLLAKLAATLHKPRGLSRILPEDCPLCLEKLPVEKMNGIGPQITRSLHGMGIFTLGQLARVPMSRLRRRFGFYGELLHQIALGIDESPVLPVDAPDIVKSMGHAYTLERDTQDPGILRGILLKLSEKVGRRLRARGLGGRTVCLALRFKDFTHFSRQQTFTDPMNDGISIYRAACRLLEESPWERHPVRLVGVSVSHVGRFFDLSDLWEDRQRKNRLLQTIDRVNDTFGEGTILRAGALVPLIRKTGGFFTRRWMLEG